MIYIRKCLGMMINQNAKNLNVTAVLSCPEQFQGGKKKKKKGFARL